MSKRKNPFSFRKRREDPRIVTELMLQAEKKTLAVHDFGGLVVWSGLSRVGKTTTGLWMMERINDAFTDENPDAFRCGHYQVGGLDDEKKAIRSLFHGTIGQLDEGLYRSKPKEDLALLLVRALQRKRIELVMVDEAGLLSIEALRGMVLARDVAKRNGHRLSIVFIGMDDLPAKIEVVPQIANRVQEWVAFKKYSAKEILRLLRELHPPYQDATVENPEVRQQVEFLRENYGGLPGLMVPFMYRLDMAGRGRGDVLPTMKEFRAAHFMYLQDRDDVHDDGNLNGKKRRRRPEDSNLGKKKRDAESKGGGKNDEPKEKPGEREDTQKKPDADNGENDDSQEAA